MEWVVKSDIGVVRSENQDKASVLKSGDNLLAVLCDGMGGHQGGKYASQIAIEVFSKEFNRSFPKRITDRQISSWFSTTLKKAKKAMVKFAQRDKNLLDMGTTVTSAIVTEQKIYIFNVGDSRTYIYNGLFHQITIDHNLRNHYIKKYNYSEEKAATVRAATALTSALGPHKKVLSESFIVANDKDTRYVVLTSDGIHDYISKPNFEAIIGAEAPLEKKSESLIKQSIKGKSADNMTVIIVEVR